MNSFDFEEHGFDEFSNLLKKYSEKASDDSVVDVLKVGADALISDLSKLPKPKSQISQPGYTHLIDSFSYRVNGSEIEAGWGKYYGPMLENGTNKMNARKHLRPTWNQNKEKYYSIMRNKLLN